MTLSGRSPLLAPTPAHAAKTDVPGMQLIVDTYYLPNADFSQR
jgi:hypothetical protein